MNATGVTAGPAECNGRLLLSKWRDSLHVTCGLTACTPGSAPGPTLGNEYGKTLPFYIKRQYGDRAKLLFTDNDSLCYEIKTDDFYKDIADAIESRFDTSEYPKDHPSVLNQG